MAKLTGQQKAERGRAKMRGVAKSNALDKSIFFKKEMKGKKKTLKENR